MSSNNSYGQFWYGGSNFPGFIYKKNTAGGVKRSTQFPAGGNALCNKNVWLYNRYKPGFGGVGATSTSVRRAKNRLATSCISTKQCGQFYQYLGRYDNYTCNPNGYFPFPTYPGEPIAKFNSPATVDMFGVLNYQK